MEKSKEGFLLDPLPSRERESTAHEFLILDNPKFRERLVGKVEYLIKEIIKIQPTTIFFLDKGARPISWLFNELWDHYSSGMKKPEIRFMDVGRRDEGFHSANNPPLEGGYIYHATPEEIDAFRKTFPNLSGNVFIVDDIFDTGLSISRAEELIHAVNSEVHIYKNWFFSKFDYRRMPWSHPKYRGSTGVLESGGIITKAITQEYVDDIRTRLWEYFDTKTGLPVGEALEDYCRPIYPDMKTLVETELSPLARVVEEQKVHPRPVSEALHELSTLRLPELPAVEDSDLKKKQFFFDLIKIWDRLWDLSQIHKETQPGFSKFGYVSKYNSDEELKLEKVIDKLYENFVEATEGIHWYNYNGTSAYSSSAISNVDEYHYYTDTGAVKLRDLAKQLRKEMHTLAIEKIATLDKTKEN